MASKATKQCKLRYQLIIQRGKRNPFCCEARHGFMLKMWKCVGRESEECPLVIAAEQGVHPTLVGGRVLQGEELEKLISPANVSG